MCLQQTFFDKGADRVIPVRMVSCFFPRSFLNRRSPWVLDGFTGQSPGMWTNKVGHFYPGGAGSAREVGKSLTRGWEAAG